MFESSLIRRPNNQVRITCETEQNKNSSHIAGWLRAWITRTWFESNAKQLIFFVLLPLIFVKNIFAYDQKYPLEISTAIGIIDHADYECAIFIHRTFTFRNSSRDDMLLFEKYEIFEKCRLSRRTSFGEMFEIFHFILLFALKDIFQIHHQKLSIDKLLNRL